MPSKQVGATEEPLLTIPVKHSKGSLLERISDEVSFYVPRGAGYLSIACLILGVCVCFLPTEADLTQSSMMDGAMSLAEEGKKDNSWRAWLMWALKLLGVILLMRLCEFVVTSVVASVSMQIAIQKLDRKYLGVDVKIGGCDGCMPAVFLDLAQGSVSIRQIRLKNPDGFTSPYFLQATKFVIDLDVCKLAKSWLKEFEIETIDLKYAEMYLEYSTEKQQSNLGSIVDFVNSNATMPSFMQEFHSSRSWTLKKVVFDPIKLKAVGPGGGELTGSTDEITFEDFSAEKLNDGKTHVFDDIAVTLFRVFIEKVREAGAQFFMEAGILK